MNKYINLIAELKIASILKDKNSRKFNKNFKVLDLETYNIELPKLVYDFCTHTYLREDCIRNILLYQPKEYLDYIKAIMDFAYDNNIKDDMQIISYFISSLHYSYKYGLKYKESRENKEQIALFNTVFENRAFYSRGKIYNNTLEFANDILEFATNNPNDMYRLDGFLYDGIRISSESNPELFQEKLDILVKQKSFYN